LRSIEYRMAHQRLAVELALDQVSCAPPFTARSATVVVVP
jgi:hypothetical protein